MSDKNVLSIAIIGMSPEERNVLRRLFELTSSRDRSYTLVSLTTGPPPDILLIDCDDEIAMTAWRELCTYKQAIAELPTVILGKANVGNGVHRYHLQRPLFAPRVLATLDQIAIAPPPPPSAVATKHYKVLVVDDSVMVRKQVEMELQQLGIQADFAENGEQALEYLKGDTAYDIIFMDVVMPGMDGYTVCKTIKRDKQHKQVAVVMLTGKGSPFDRVRGKLAGCNSYLAKPVTRDLFQDTVKKYLPQLVSNEAVIV